METIDINDTFSLAYRFVTETHENIFLTGKAGTGKTTFLKYLKENCSKNIVVAAPTGVAAINAGGVTLHSLFQLPFHPFLPEKKNKEELLSRIRFNKQRQQLLRKMDLLIIDEISMVRCDILDAIDTILRSVRRDHRSPFGGVQLLCIGDLYQLPPVAQREEWNILKEYYASPFFFDSKVVLEQKPLLIELTKVYRQSDDVFIDLLNKVRNNLMSKEDFDDLHLRFDPYFRPATEEKYITLTSHNNQADLINSRELNKLSGSMYSYKAVIEDDFPENNYPAEETLQLKTGAQVMFIKNDVVQKRYFNGKIGIVSSLDDEEIIVECDGQKIHVLQDTWENTRYTVNRSDGKLNQEILGRFTQFPLRLAWAVTIHKSQGLTFQKVMIDAASAFSSGQVYVALSRCTSLDGIVLLSKIPPSAIYSNDHVIKGQQGLLNKNSLADQFAIARQIFSSALIEEIFSFNDLSDKISHLAKNVMSHADKLNNNAVSWINEIENKILANKKTGLKFIQLVEKLMKEETVIENNTALQKRINDAAEHFHPLVSEIYQSLNNHQLITEHKEAAVVIDESISALLTSVHHSLHYLQYCRQPFTVTGFLQHKLKYNQPRISVTSYASGKKQVDAGTSNTALFEELRIWRNRICEQLDLPIYLVANQNTLKEIAEYLPLNKKDLQMISGFGKAKAERFGEEIISMVEDYCSRNNLESNIAEKAVHPKRERKSRTTDITDTKDITFKLFKKGKTIPEIAIERKLTTGTIETHLEIFISTGEINIDELVPKPRQAVINEAIRVHGATGLKALKDNLPEDITYSEIRMVIEASKFLEAAGQGI
jgi:hypothetical protein